MQVETLAQQVADLQDEAEAREGTHAERVAALQAAVERLSGEAAAEADAQSAELAARVAALEEQASAVPCPFSTLNKS
jgi:hypothetical protein